MAHEKMYAICGDKCRVLINDLTELVLPTSSWRIDPQNGGYELIIYMQGLSQWVNPTFAINVNIDLQNDKELFESIKKAWSLVTMIDTEDGIIIARCMKKPEVDIPVKMKIT